MVERTIDDYLREKRAQHTKTTVGTELGLWSGVSSYLVMPGHDLRDREYLEADYEQAVMRLLHQAAQLPPALRPRAVGALVAVHHQEMGSWFTTSLFSKSFHVLRYEGGTPEFLLLQSGMAADLLFLLDGRYDIERLVAAQEVLDAAAHPSTKATRAVEFPCHPGHTVAIATGATLVMHTPAMACDACGRRWAFERSIRHIAEGAGYDDVFARDATYTLK